MKPSVIDKDREETPLPVTLVKAKELCAPEVGGVLETVPEDR